MLAGVFSLFEFRERFEALRRNKLINYTRTFFITYFILNFVHKPDLTVITLRIIAIELSRSIFMISSENTIDFTVTLFFGVRSNEIGNATNALM